MKTTTRKEHPILFRPELVRKILGGKKTQTRRPLGLLPFGAPSVITPHELDDGRFGFFDDADVTYVCKFGRPGDVLWVRETWQQVYPLGARDRLASAETPVKGNSKYRLLYAATLDEEEPPRWRPSIHMPRWACRLFLEITDVRVERVQDISEADAVAEGMEPWVECYAAHPLKPQSKPRFIGAKHKATCREAFEQAWDATYPGSWERNDWVWVISFRRTEA